MPQPRLMGISAISAAMTLHPMEAPNAELRAPIADEA